LFGDDKPIINISVFSYLQKHWVLPASWYNLIATTKLFKDLQF
jgi:hypothetical protein